MIQAWKDLRFSAKLTLIFFLVLSLTIGVITIRQSYSSFRLLEEKSLEDMENLAEQVILNFTQTLEDIENSCYVAMISREVPKNMSGSATYAVQKYTLATMISSATSYDYIMARNSQRQLISTDFRNDTPTEQRSQIEADCRTILEEHQENTLGSCQWIRMDSGHVYLLRDVYDTQPLRHMGVIVLHIRQPFFAASSASENTGFLFLDKNGDFLTYTGTELPEGMTDEVIADAQAGALSSKNNWSGGEYFAVSVAGQPVVGHCDLLYPILSNRLPPDHAERHRTGRAGTSGGHGAGVYSDKIRAEEAGRDQGIHEGGCQRQF